jgi:hypothetical protein
MAFEKINETVCSTATAAILPAVTGKEEANEDGH